MKATTFTPESTAMQSAKALAENRPNGMLLFVETDHDPAVRLYQSLGFEFVPEGDNQTAFWKIPC